MLAALGPISSALDAIQSLTSSHKSGNRNPASPFDVAPAAQSGSAAPNVSNGFSQISPATMSALIAAQGQSTAGNPAPVSASDALKDLFSQLDADHDGKISKSEFENALGAGGTNIAKADDVFGKLDGDGDGSVTLGEMSSALKGHGHGHHHHAGGIGSDKVAGSSSDTLLKALQGASSSSVNNSDGSTTTSVTYADGSKVTLTSPAANAGSGAATSSYNFVERLIARQAQTIASSANASLSVTA